VASAKPRARPRLEELARLTARRDQAKANADARHRDLAERRRELSQLREEQREHRRATGAGATRDARLERRLAAALAEPGVVAVEGRLTDEAFEERLEGARLGHEAAERELREFCSGHLAALEADLLRGVEDERRAVLAAARELARALHPVRQRQRRIASLHVTAGSLRVPDLVQQYDQLARALAGLERE
jgi:hypothetical protein